MESTPYNVLSFPMQNRDEYIKISNRYVLECFSRSPKCFSRSPSAPFVPELDFSVDRNDDQAVDPNPLDSDITKKSLSSRKVIDTTMDDVRGKVDVATKSLTRGNDEMLRLVSATKSRGIEPTRMNEEKQHLLPSSRQILTTDANS